MLVCNLNDKNFGWNCVIIYNDSLEIVEYSIYIMENTKCEMQNKVIFERSLVKLDLIIFGLDLSMSDAKQQCLPSINNPKSEIHQQFT